MTSQLCWLCPGGGQGQRVAREDLRDRRLAARDADCQGQELRGVLHAWRAGGTGGVHTRRHGHHQVSEAGGKVLS